MISVEPSRYIKKMSQMIKDDKSLQNEVKNIIFIKIFRFWKGIKKNLLERREIDWQRIFYMN